MNAFECLGLEVSLRLSDSEISEAFREKAAAAHPDSGGNADDFTKLQAARDTLSSPGKLLSEWAKVKDLEIEAQGAIEDDMMELFSKVAAVGSEAAAALKEQAAAQTAITKAISEVSLIQCRETVESLLAELEQEIAKRVSCFTNIEEGAAHNETFRSLVFLEKWRATLRGVYGSLMR